MTFRFEKLAVWHKAIEFGSIVYEVTRAFPTDERFGLTNQMRRAAVSVSSDIAEGSGRRSDRDFGRFLEIAYGSGLEVVSQACVARQQSFLSDADHGRVYECADELGRMLSGLQSSLSS